MPTTISATAGDVNGASKKYDVVIDSLTNSAVALNVLAVSLVSGAWAKHESIVIDVWSQWQSTTATLTLKVKVGSSSFTLFTASSAGINAIVQHRIHLHRIGSVIYVLNGAASSGVAKQVHAPKPLTGSVVYETQFDGNPAGYAGGTITGVDFTADNTLALEAQFNIASALDTFTVLSAIVQKI